MPIFAHRQRLSPAQSDFGKKLKIYPGQNSRGIVKFGIKKWFFQPHGLKNGRSQKSYCNQKSLLACPFTTQRNFGNWFKNVETWFGVRIFPETLAVNLPVTYC